MLRKVFLLAASATVVTGCEPTSQGYAPAQPIAYSHAVHAGAMQIDCQYCHFAAERGRHAGIPPAEICMNCHKQVQKDHPEIIKVIQAIESGEPIRWTRVHSLPAHVYFDHSAHVNQGVACANCHGPVESMGKVEQWTSLTMGWCLECHRDKSDPSYAPSVDAPVRASPLTDCAVCHH